MKARPKQYVPVTVINKWSSRPLQLSKNQGTSLTHKDLKKGHLQGNIDEKQYFNT